MADEPSVPLKEYLESRIEEQRSSIDRRFIDQNTAVATAFTAAEKAVAAALSASDKATAAAFAAAKEAVAKAEVAQQKVNENQNEFRGTLRDQAAGLMPRSETELLVAGLRDKIDEIRKTVDTSTGHSGGMNALWGYIVGAVGVAAAIVAMLTRH